MIPLPDAQAYVLGRVRPLPVERVPLAAARDRVTAAPVATAEDVPPFANTAVDGYAVVAADTAAAGEAQPVRLPVVAEVAAGHPAAVRLQPGQAMRIFTGAPLPDGADAVVMVERTERLDEGAVVAVLAPAAPGDHIRPAGDDARAGEVVVAAGEELSPGHLGVLATVGAGEVQVYRRPRVGVLSTGDELVDGGPLAPGQIRDANRATLLGLLADDGFEPVDLGLVPDDEAAIAGAIESGAASCDALISSGGVSMGDIDLVRVVLDRLGDMTWMQIAIRPAKPFAFGLLGAARTPVFGLPGNPVSSMVSYELLARPALRAMAGHPESRLRRRPVAAVATEALARRPDGKVHLARVVGERAEDGVLHVRSAGGQGSHQLTAMARAHGLALVPDGYGIAAGGQVQVLLLREP
jgi:molybdenum cofactor synthesis domain-containing protein